MSEERISESEAASRGKRYGNTHGYYGERGGWIYRIYHPEHLCQGWNKFYYMHRMVIDAWIKKMELEDGHTDSDEDLEIFSILK